jgi:transcriptional regulator GlxA family with amidase domain
VLLGAGQAIALEFGDPDLTPGRIAHDMNVSSRTLARVFAAKHETIMRRVFDERVRRAAAFLTAPASAHRSVTDIALACGFNDVSHFGRVFTAKMQMTPSEWRRRSRAQSATL